MLELIGAALAVSFGVWAIVYMREPIAKAIDHAAKRRDKTTLDNTLRALGYTEQERDDYKRAFVCLPASSATPDQIRKFARECATGKTWAK